MALLRMTLMSALASSALLNASASAQNATDVKCLLVSNFYSKNAKDDKIRRVAESATYFFLGRIDRRLSRTQLKTALEAEQRALSRANVGPSMDACHLDMQASAKMLESVSQELKQPAKQSQKASRSVR